ncbi:hypothetical protein L3Q72_09790 [Vibrio sp. JC009]|uniref:ABC transporter substrate-binding protein n=1 Tax=Vibrio sp. JC009 TaxID=2912314 RepID=UPI0023AFA06D|nr:hypothetical protein [Vibrio sp. JC009]WED20931.1 hypothetical protein L3Q72_09790 [Vibrio sp. JC009]
MRIMKSVGLSLLLLFLWSPLTSASTILVIESYHAEYLWDQSYKQGLKDMLGMEHELVFFEMDTKRLPESKYQERAEAAWKVYQDLDPTLVILGDDNALKYLAPMLLKTDTPVVYLGINANPRKYGVVGAPNFTGVIERPLLRRSILMLEKLLPVKRVLVLLDSKETARVIKEDIFQGKDAMRLSGIYLDIKLVSRFSEWQRYVLAAKDQGYDALIAGLYQTLNDDSGLHVDPEVVIDWTSKNTEIPPFGFWDFSIGANKNIGGYVIFGYEEGKLAGQMAMEMLANKGKRLRQETGGQGRFMFSKSLLHKWGIDLPDYIAKQATLVD